MKYRRRCNNDDKSRPALPRLQLVKSEYSSSQLFTRVLCESIDGSGVTENLYKRVSYH
jgi:hypothetical protein